MTWNREQGPRTPRIDPSKNELGSEQPFLAAPEAETSEPFIDERLISSPLVLVDGEYIEVPPTADRNEIFGAEATLTENGFVIEKTLEELAYEEALAREEVVRQQAIARQEDETRRARLAQVHSHVLHSVGIHHPVEWGPDQSRDVRASRDGLTHSI